MATVLTGTQSRWKDSYASSPEVRLTLRANGEEQVQIFDGITGFVRAGFDEPTAAATCAAGTAGGSLTSGKFVGYRYVYAATTRYPLVENAVDGGGSVAPRSNPSPVSSVFTVTANGKVVVTCTGTNRTDIDEIWIYRTVECDTSAECSTRLDAGDLYFLASIGNTGSTTVTASYTDDGTVVLTSQLEIDNYPAPIFQYTVYDGTYWWGFGNHPLEIGVTLDGTSTITIDGDDVWYDGRDGQTVTFEGITTGGFDGLGTFYFKWLTSTTAQLCSDIDLTTALAVAYSGTTTATIRGYSTTLYRSKPRNPFSWGWTELLIDDIRVPQEWAYKVGGGRGVGLATIPSDRILKVDTEEPSRCYTFNLNNADSPTTMGETRQVIEERYTSGSHFCQFPATAGSGQTSLASLDAKNYAILQSNSQTQDPILSGEVMAILRSMKQGDNDAYFYHGLYDAETELNCFWIKTRNLTDDGGDPAPHYCDTLIWQHASSGMWGTMTDLDISASASIYDPVERKFFTMLGTESGQIARGFDTSTRSNFVTMGAPASGTVTASYRWSHITRCCAGASLNGQYAVYTYGAGSTLGIWFDLADGGTTIPAGAAACTRTLEVNTITSASTATQVATAIVTALGTDANFYVQDKGDGTFLLVEKAANNTVVTAGSAGTTAFAVNSYSSCITGATGGSVANSAGTWNLILNSSNQPTYWFRTPGAISTQASYFIVDRWITIATEGTMSTYATPATYSSHSIATGVILSRWRTYFTLGLPTTTKRNVEMWLSSKNVGTTAGPTYGYGQYCSFFKEFDTTPSSTFTLSRDYLPASASADSVNWLTKTNIPSTMLNQFGIEVFEVGIGEWTNYSVTLKLQKSGG